MFRREDQVQSGPRPASRTRYLATGSQTDGDYGLFESLLPPGAMGPGPHFHQTFSESFYVLDGFLSLLGRNGEFVSAGAGEHVYVPRQSVHGFRNASASDPVRFLILFTPGTPREEYFEGLARMFAEGKQPTEAEIDAFALLHDQVNIRD
jgi:quercetin dioxygenase-like cupin family protein